MNKATANKKKLLQINVALNNVHAALIAAEGIMPVLFKAYELAISHNLIQPFDTRARLNLLRVIVPELREEVKGISDLIMEMSRMISNK